MEIYHYAGCGRTPDPETIELFIRKYHGFTLEKLKDNFKDYKNVQMRRLFFYIVFNKIRVVNEKFDNSLIMKQEELEI